MSLTRRFLIAPSLARLIHRDCAGSRVSEGYFANQSGRTSSVRLEGDTGSLILVDRTPEGGAIEERTEVPPAHAAALLDVAPGKIAFARTRLNVSGRELWIDRFMTPGVLDLVIVQFETAEHAAAFAPLEWFGLEVTKDAAYQSRSLALEGLPQAPSVPVTNGTVDAVLDALEGRFGPAHLAPARSARSPRVEALNQFANAFTRAAPAEQGVTSAQGDESAPVNTPVVQAEDVSQDHVIRELARSLGPQRHAGR
jgi:CYTH domain-containing protein